MNFKNIAAVAAGVVLLGSAVALTIRQWKQADEEPTPEALAELQEAFDQAHANRK